MILKLLRVLQWSKTIPRIDAGRTHSVWSVLTHSAIRHCLGANSKFYLMGISCGFRPNIKCTILNISAVNLHREVTEWTPHRELHRKCMCALSVCVQGRVLRPAFLFLFLEFMIQWNGGWVLEMHMPWGRTAGWKEIITHFPVPSTLATHSARRPPLHVCKNQQPFPGKGSIRDMEHYSSDLL